jgi:DNA-binding MarR family transcriptional regulator
MRSETGVAGNSGRAKAKLRMAAVRPDFHLESHVFFPFTQIFGRRNRQLAEALRPLSISIPQWRVLAVLHEFPDIAMSRLSDLATIDRTTLTRALDNMVERGLVERRTDAADRRSIRLRLTDAGLELFFRVLPGVVDQNEKAVTGFSASELAALRSMLHRMVDNLDGEQTAPADTGATRRS